ERANPAAAIRASIEQSLRRLGRESVDLLQLHNSVWRGQTERGGLTEAEAMGAVADGMQQVVAAGLARHAGFTGVGETAALAALIDSGRFETMQSYFNAVNPSAGF